MLSTFQIKNIALFEAKTLFRSWFFRILGILMLTIIFFYNLAMIVFGEGEIQHAVPSTIPYSSLMYLNVVQAIIAVFLASDFLKRDKKLDTTEVIYTRSMSNGDYIIGKLLGNIFVFTTLNIAVLGVSLIFNLILGFNTVNWLAYLAYFFLVSIPTLVFIVGLSFILMNIIKNQAVTFAILIGYIFLTMIYLKNQYYYLFDYMVYSIPVLYSDIIGFADLKILLVQRLMYFLLGLAFISFSVYRLWRLPNRPFSNILPVIFTFVFLAISILLGSIHVSNANRGEKLRTRMVKLNNHYANYARMAITSQNIKIVHKGSSIDAESTISCINKTSTKIDTLIISLNPSLNVSKVLQGGAPANFTRKEHLLLIKSNVGIDPNEAVTLNISYSGTVDDEACYIDIDEKSRAKTENSDMVNIGKVYNYISSDFVLLTPESNWYPKADVGFNRKNTLWMLPSLCKFSLAVTTERGMDVISQGESTKNDNAITFTNQQPLSGISIVVGKYKKITFENKQPEIGVYIKPNHDFFSKPFSQVKDTAHRIIYDALQDYSSRINMAYPYKRLFLVEVPMQVQSHQRFWSYHLEQMQPELIFVQEKGGQNEYFTFERNMERSKRWGSGKGLSEKDLQVEELKNFLTSFTKQATTSVSYERNQSIEVEKPNPYFIFDAFYGYNHPVESKDYPTINTILSSYLTNQTNAVKLRWYSTGFTESERAVILLQKEQLASIMLNPDYYSLADNIIKMKGEVLLSLLEKRIGKSSLDSEIKDIFSEYQGQVIPFDKIDNRFKEKFGQDLGSQLNLWLNSNKLPSYRIGKVDAYKVTDGERQRYQTNITIGNDGTIEGIIKVAIKQENDEKSNDEKDLSYKTYVIAANQTKAFSIVSDKQPSKIIINTNASMNVPIKHEIPIAKVEGDGSMKIQVEERTLSTFTWDEPNEIIVDNDDSLFHVENVSKQGLLIKFANRFKKREDEYQGYTWWMVSGKWGKFVSNVFFGKYFHSADAIRSGTGSAKAIWQIPVKSKGQYDIYTFIPRDKTDDDEQHLGEYHYTIYHDDGESKVKINGKEVDGWVLLGTYYCSPNSAKVELNNESNARVVIADAIKAVKF